MHDDHRTAFLPTAQPRLLWHGRDPYLASVLMRDQEFPRPLVGTAASDGTFAVWTLSREASR